MVDMAAGSIPADDVSSTCYVRSKPLDLPLDMSFMNLAFVEDLLAVPEPRPVGIKSKAPLKNDDNKYMTRIVRFNNNLFTELTQFRTVLDGIIADPMLLSWIDLSFNTLPKIDEVLCQFQNLQILYLHGNTITNLNEVDKLIELPNLKKLTLHGNPIENDKSYRLYCLTRVPRLHSFDMAGITRGDRLTADIWQKNLPIKKKASRLSTDI